MTSTVPSFPPIPIYAPPSLLSPLTIGSEFLGDTAARASDLIRTRRVVLLLAFVLVLALVLVVVFGLVLVLVLGLVPSICKSL